MLSQGEQVSLSVWSGIEHEKGLYPWSGRCNSSVTDGTYRRVSVIAGICD